MMRKVILALSTLSLTHSRTFRTGFVLSEYMYVYVCVYMCDHAPASFVLFVIPHIVCVMMFSYSCPILCIHP